MDSRLYGDKERTGSNNKENTACPRRVCHGAEPFFRFFHYTFSMLWSMSIAALAGDFLVFS